MLRSPASLVAMLALFGSVGALGIAPDARAATLTVANCNDSGPGSLRATIASASSGDVIDLRGLSCRVIRTTSAIAIPQGSLTLQGAGWRRIAIDIDWSDSVLRHTGGGTLRLRGLSIAHGTRQVQTALGGCVYSNGNVDAYDTSIRGCGAHGTGAPPTTGMGGGIYADGDVTVRYSAVGPATARGGTTAGGAIFAGGKVTLLRAQIRGVAARGGGVYATTGLHADTTTFTQSFAHRRGAAINARGPVTIANSTLSQNTTSELGAGLWIEGAGPVLIVNTTISGNRASAWSAGFIAPDATIANSTIAFNLDWPSTGGTCDSAALAVAGQLHLESTIASNSICNIDFTPVPLPDIAVTGTDPVIGSDNLVMWATDPMPPDTITTDPMLGALADNGGRTLTHAVPLGSAALDAGNNEAGLAYDQRGPGFPRVKNGTADIGAYER